MTAETDCSKVGRVASKAAPLDATGRLWTFAARQAQLGAPDKSGLSQRPKRNGRPRAKDGRRKETNGSIMMAISRRDVLLGSAGALGAASFSFPAPAIAQSETIKIGWLAALTGPSSAPAIGFNRGVPFAVDEINAAGGVNGRKIEVVTRDTQGDPTKAVNASVEMISRQQGGWRSGGRSIPASRWRPRRLMARASMPNIHPCVVDSLIDPKKYPNAFPPRAGERAVGRRGAQLLSRHRQGEEDRRHRRHHRLRHHHGHAHSVGRFQEGRRANVVYHDLIDATQPDMTPDMLRMQDAGAEVIVPWSVSTGMAGAAAERARRMRLGRAVRRPSRRSAPARSRSCSKSRRTGRRCTLIGYRSCSYDADGKLPPRTQAFVDKLKGKVELVDTLAVVGRRRRRRDQSGRQGGREVRIDRSRGHHRVLEHAERSIRAFRQLHLYADGAQRLSDRRRRDVASRIPAAERRLSRWRPATPDVAWTRPMLRVDHRLGARDGRDLRADRRHLQHDVLRPRA